MQPFAADKADCAFDQGLPVSPNLEAELMELAQTAEERNFTLTPIANNVLQQFHIDGSCLFSVFLLPSYLSMEGGPKVRYPVAQQTPGANYTLEAFRETSWICHDPAGSVDR